MKVIQFVKITGMLMAAWGMCGLTGCSEEINNYEKETPSVATNQVFISEKFASLAFCAKRSAEGEVTNMDTLIAKLVVNSTSPAGGDLKVKMAVDPVLVDVYNQKNGTSYRQLLSEWIKLNKSTLTIPEGCLESVDTLTVALAKPLEELTDLNGYLMPVRITTATGYDAEVNYAQRVSYLTLDINQENGIGFVEGNNNAMFAANENFTGCNLPLMAYMASDKDIQIQLEVDNSLVTTFNSRYGTDYKTLPVTDWELPSVILPAGSVTVAGQIIYKGLAAQLAGDNYLIPVKMKSAIESGETEPLKALRTDTYYLMVNGKQAFNLETADVTLGVKETDRGGYNIIAADYSFTKGSWKDMLTDGDDFWVLDAPADVIIDLGREVQQITGICYQANMGSMTPASMDLSYAGETLYGETGLTVSLGSVSSLPSKSPVYFQFIQPVNARYIRLSNITAKSKFYTCQQFYIYTQN